MTDNDADKRLPGRVPPTARGEMTIPGAEKTLPGPVLKAARGDMKVTGVKMKLAGAEFRSAHTDGGRGARFTEAGSRRFDGYSKGITFRKSGKYFRKVMIIIILGIGFGGDARAACQGTLTGDSHRDREGEEMKGGGREDVCPTGAATNANGRDGEEKDCIHSVE